MWGVAAPSHARGDGSGDGGSGGGLPALEPGSLRLQLAGGQRLGGRVAWDAASGLLAAELQAEQGSSTIPVAILDPQAPEVRADGCAVGARGVFESLQAHPVSTSCSSLPIQAC